MVALALVHALLAQPLRTLAMQVQGRDSVGKTMRPLPLGTDSMSAFHLERVRNNPVWLSSVGDGYNRITVEAAFDKGKFIPSQGSTQTQHYRADAEGKTSWKGTHLYGRFSYRRTLEDSTRLRHQTRINPTAPIYFGSLRYNHYERSIYTIAVAGQRDLAQGKLPITMAFDYRIGEHFSNNDPRGAINDFQLNVLGGAGYRSKQWEYHLSARYGYGRERVQVAFKDEKYTKNTEDPLYVNWYMNGYGNAIQRISNQQRQYDDGFRRFGAGGHVRLDARRQGIWKLDVNWLRERQRFKRLDETIQTYTLLDEYTLDRWSALLTAVWQLSGTRSVQAEAGMTVGAGSDFEPVYQARNYTYNRTIAHTGVRLNGVRWQYGARGYYDLTEQRDGIAGVTSTSSALHGDLYAGHRLHLSEGRQVRANLNLGFHYALDNDLVFPALAETPFSTHVVYHDFLYQASSAVTGGLSGAYLLPAANGSWWEIGLSANYQRRGGLPKLDYPVPSSPGRDIFAAEVRLSWFF